MSTNQVTLWECQGGHLHHVQREAERCVLCSCYVPDCTNPRDGDFGFCQTHSNEREVARRQRMIDGLTDTDQTFDLYYDMDRDFWAADPTELVENATEDVEDASEVARVIAEMVVVGGKPEAVDTPQLVDVVEELWSEGMGDHWEDFDSAELGEVLKAVQAKIEGLAPSHRVSWAESPPIYLPTKLRVDVSRVAFP